VKLQAPMADADPPSAHFAHPGPRPAPYDVVMTASLADASDGSLVVAIGRFREDALAEAYRRHAGAVFGLARRVLADATAAEEIVQEIFLRLWNDPARFDPERGSLRSFLLAQTHGRAVDMLRSDSSRRLRETREARSAATAGYDIEHEVWDLAVADRVKQAIAVLPEDERRAIELAYFGGHTYREVAAVLGTPEGTVKSRIRVGLKRLRTTLVDIGAGTSWES
jgi:RNA polymerase sigma-70 factor (ECF subfamily)